MKLIFLALILGLSTASAASLHWFSALDQLNFDADNGPMDKGFRFELGVFRDGFEPTAANRGQWSAHWVSAQREIYNEGNRWYSGFLVVDENEVPFHAGAEAWVWGFSGDASSGDWILFRSADWRWPQADPKNPLVRHWNAKDADTVLIGSVAQTGPKLLQAASVAAAVPPSTSFGQWARENNKPGHAREVVEFATGGDHPPMRLSRSHASQIPGVTEIRISRLADRTLSRVELEVSEDLKQWRPYQAYARFKEATATELIFEVDADTGDRPQLFFRARYEP
jgi:hypothetical protein